MTSAIDATKPVSGSPTTASVRAQFAAAASEITAIQAVDATQTADIAALEAISVVAMGRWDESGGVLLSAYGCSRGTVSATTVEVVTTAVAASNEKIVAIATMDQVGYAANTQIYANINSTTEVEFQFKQVTDGASVADQDFHFVIYHIA